MPTLIFDIETVGEDFEAMDEATKDALTRWIKREAEDEKEFEAMAKDLKDQLGFSPLTGEIAAIGVLDHDRGKGVVYFQAPRQEAKTEMGLLENDPQPAIQNNRAALYRNEVSGTGQAPHPEAGEAVAQFEEGDFTFKPATEKEMLEAFWKGATQYDEFVTFNGRTFDAPFLMIRSAVHEVKPTQNLLAFRYIESQKWGPRHVDLLDQLSFYGAMRKRGSLHLWCRLFGIESPKQGGITGDQIGALFAAGKYADIARYNAGDLRATRALYERWKKYLDSSSGKL